MSRTLTDPPAAPLLDAGSLASGILDSLAASIAVVDASGLIIAVNAAWRRFAAANGAGRAGEVGGSYLAVCDRAAEGDGDETAALAAAGIRSLTSGRAESFTLEYPCHSPAERRWFVANGTVLTVNGERYVVVAHEDVTARKIAQDDLRASEQKWRTLFEILPVGVSVLDQRQELLDSNPALHEILQLTPAELAGGAHRLLRYLRGDGTLLPPEEFPSTRAIREQRLVHDEIVILRPDGGTVTVAVDAAPLPTPHTSAVVVVSDVSARVRARDELRRAKEALEAANRDLEAALGREEALARRDFLTGLPNRRHFYESADHELAVAERYRYPLSVILFDVDRFKEVNDRFGHGVGDEVLRRLADVAGATLRKADTLARHGGEEFAVLLPHTDLRQAGVVAEQLRATIAALEFAGGAERFAVTVSAGVAEALPAGDSIDRLMRRADQALYAAKAAGRNTVRA